MRRSVFLNNRDVRQLIYTPFKAKEYIAKSFILDAINSFGGFMGIRSIDFWYNGVKLQRTEENTYCYSNDSASGGYVDNAFITSLSKVGLDTNMGWKVGSSYSYAPPYRIIAIFEVPIIFDTIIINNFHTSGNYTNRGIKDNKINITLDEYYDDTPGEVITNPKLIFDSQFREHISSDQEDPEILTLL